MCRKIRSKQGLNLLYILCHLQRETTTENLYYLSVLQSGHVSKLANSPQINYRGFGS